MVGGDQGTVKKSVTGCLEDSEEVTWQQGQQLCRARQEGTPAWSGPGKGTWAPQGLPRRQAVEQEAGRAQVGVTARPDLGLPGPGTGAVRLCASCSGGDKMPAVSPGAKPVVKRVPPPPAGR